MMYGLPAIESEIANIVLVRLSAARASYLDNLNNTQLLNIPNLSTLTAVRIAYLDNINQAGLLQLTATRVAYLDNINQVGLLQLTAARVAYLDNLSGGAVALAATALSTAIWTSARAGYLDNINNAQLLNIPDLSTLTSTRIAYLDLLNSYLNHSIADLITRSKGFDQIYDLLDSMLDLTRVGNTITADGTEQTVYSNDAPSIIFDPAKAHIDTTNMQAGDTLVVKEYYRIKSEGNYILKSSTTYNDAQTIPLKEVALSPNLFGVKLTIQQTAGTNRAYDYEVYYGG